MMGGPVRVQDVVPQRLPEVSVRPAQHGVRLVAAVVLVVVLDQQVVAADP